VSSFALLVVVGGLAVAEAVPAGARRMSVAGLAVLVASYARPGALSRCTHPCCRGAVAFVREARGATDVPRGGRSRYRSRSGPVRLDRLPATGRTTASIACSRRCQEHFAWNWNRWHDAHASALSIWRQEFGTADTPLAPCWRTPRRRPAHRDNTVGTLRLIGGSTFDHFPLLPSRHGRARSPRRTFSSTAAAFGAVVATIARPEHRRALRDRYGTALFQYAVITAVCDGDGDRLSGPALRHDAVRARLLTAALATSLLVPTSPRFAAGTRVAIALVCLAAVPRPFVVPSTYAVAGRPFTGRITVLRRVADTVAFVRALRLPLPVRVLSTTDGIGALLGDGFDEVDVWGMGTQPLEAYMRAHDVGLVINLEGGRQSLAVDDPLWSRLQLHPEELGFIRVPVPGHETVGVFVRNDSRRAAGTRR
jgi:hypothetical protein